MFSARRFDSCPSLATVVLAVGVVTAGLTGCQQAPSPEVLATVNGKEIVRSEVDRLYKQSLADTTQPQSKEVAAMQRLNILHGLIEDEIVQQRAAKLNLVATDEEVDAKLTDMKAPLTQEEFDRQLKEKNLTLEDLRRDIRRTLTKNKLVNKEIESKVNITDAEISNYFKEHKSEFNLIEPKYHLARIVVTNEPAQQVNNLQNNKASNDGEAKKKMQTLRNRLESGEDFASIAVRFSEDPASSSNGGDLGFVSESQLRTDPEVYAAVNNLKAGQTTETLSLYRGGEGSGKKVIGYAIYLLIEKRPAGQAEMSDPSVQQRIRQQLRDAHAQLLQNAYSEMIYNEAKIHNYLAEEILKNGAQ